MNPILLDLLKKTLVTGIISGCVYLFFESPVASPEPEPEPEPEPVASLESGSRADEPEPDKRGGVEKITHREELQLILLDDTEEENPNLIYPPLRKQN